MSPYADIIKNNYTDGWNSIHSKIEWKSDAERGKHYVAIYAIN